MKKALILSTALVLLAGPAMAFGNKTTNHGGDASASSTAISGASAGAVAGSKSGVYGSGNSSNRNHNSNRAYGGHSDQDQLQGQIQGQSQKNRVNNSDSVTVEGDDVDQEYYNVNTPSSAGNNVWDCTQAYNGSVNVLFGGLSFGVPTDSDVCEAGKLLDMARATGEAHLIEMANQNLRDVLQAKIGYKATVLAIKDSEPVGKQVTHRAKPAWCDRVKASSTQSDRKACGLE